MNLKWTRQASGQYETGTVGNVEFSAVIYRESGGNWHLTTYNFNRFLSGGSFGKLADAKVEAQQTFDTVNV